jgi:sec-independent protein translocase protein TatA
MDLFDSWWKVLILAVLVLVLFGSRKLPGAAKSLGQSMRIFKSEISKLHDDDDEAASSAGPTTAQAAQPQLTAPAQVAAPAPSAADQQAQIDALQQQVRDMQRAAAMDPVASTKKDDF